MTDHHTHDAQADQGGDRGHGGHGWMMIVCCIPMIVIAVALVATGAASPGFLLVAITCVAMMALMMGGIGARRRPRREPRPFGGRGPVVS